MEKQAIICLPMGASIVERDGVEILIIDTEQIEFNAHLLADLRKLEPALIIVGSASEELVTKIYNHVTIPTDVKFPIITAAAIPKLEKPVKPEVMSRGVVPDKFMPVWKKR